VFEHLPDVVARREGRPGELAALCVREDHLLGDRCHEDGEPRMDILVLEEVPQPTAELVLQRGGEEDALPPSRGAREECDPDPSVEDLVEEVERDRRLDRPCVDEERLPLRVECELTEFCAEELLDGRHKRREPQGD